MTEVQISLEPAHGLERRMRVLVPAGRIDNEVESRLRAAARTANIKGFRPGKVPAHVIRQRFGAQIRQEVLQEVVQSSYSEAIARENLRPAGGPRIEAEVADQGKDLAYTAVFEVYPEFQVQGLDRLTVERQQVEVLDEDVERTIERLRRQRGSWQAVEREAGRGDRVVLDFEGRLRDQPIEGGQARNVAVVIGDGRMLADFETNLIGLRAGNTKCFAIKFPPDYPDPKLRDREVEFTATAHEVTELRPAPLDEAFIRSLGVASGDFAEFRELVRQNLQREVAARIQADVRRQIMEQLLAMNPVALPNVLVSREAAALQAEGMQTLGIKDVSEAPPLSAYTEIAQRRVRLGLIIAALIREQDIRLDQERVRQRLDELCRAHDRPEEARRAYLQNPQLMAQIEHTVIEEQVLGWLTERATVRDKPATVAALMGS